MYLMIGLEDDLFQRTRHTVICRPTHASHPPTNGPGPVTTCFSMAFFYIIRMATSDCVYHGSIAKRVRRTMGGLIDASGCILI